jgi:hypothetical protein
VNFGHAGAGLLPIADVVATGVTERGYDAAIITYIACPQAAGVTAARSEMGSDLRGSLGNRCAPDPPADNGVFLRTETKLLIDVSTLCKRGTYGEHFTAHGSCNAED